MFRETKDESLILKFWQDEQQYPRWYRDANNAWTQTWGEHLEFVRDCWRIYANETALVFVEKNGNLHFALRRGSKLDDKRVDGRALIYLRNELFESFEMLYGWVHDRNWGLKQMLAELGFTDSGCRMYKGSSHGKVLQWNCFYSKKKNSDTILSN